MKKIVRFRKEAINEDTLLELCDYLERNPHVDDRAVIDKLESEYGSLAEAFKHRDLILANRGGRDS